MLAAGSFVYDVILADPPWRHEMSRSNRKIENHYPTLALDDIKAIDVPAKPDSVLFLWATSPKLLDAMEVIAAWGFLYRTCAVWVKDRIGMGYYFRQQHELLLVSRMGTPGAPETQDRPSSIIEYPRCAHSAKPVLAHEDYRAHVPERSAAGDVRPPATRRVGLVGQRERRAAVRADRDGCIMALPSHQWRRGWLADLPAILSTVTALVSSQGHSDA